MIASSALKEKQRDRNSFVKIAVALSSRGESPGGLSSRFRIYKLKGCPSHAPVRCVSCTSRACVQKHYGFDPTSDAFRSKPRTHKVFHFLHLSPVICTREAFIFPVLAGLIIFSKLCQNLAAVSTQNHGIPSPRRFDTAGRSHLSAVGAS